MVTTRRLEQMPVISSPPPDSLLYILTDPAGVPVDHSIAFEDIVEAVGLLGDFAILGVDAEQIFGGAGNPNGSNHKVPVTISTHFTDPNNVITQAAVFFAGFSGIPGADQGSFEGASAEANVYATSVLTPAALGFEGIVHIDGVGGSIVTAIGLQGTAHVGGTSTITDLISVLGAGAFPTAGTPIVTNAYTFKAQEPTIGVHRFTWQGVGRHRFARSPSATGNAVEISNQTDLLQWANDGSKWFGYASDGASVRLTLDPSDGTATGRIVSGLFGSGKHVSLANGGSEVVGIGFDGKFTLAGAVDFILDATTGSKIGTAVTQKLGFWSATPIVQPAGASQAASVTTAATQTTPWGFSTQAQADGIITLLNAIRLALVNAGIIKGAA